MNDKELAAIRKRVMEAKSYEPDMLNTFVSMIMAREMLNKIVPTPEAEAEYDSSESQTRKDITFIAHARKDILDLLEHIEWTDKYTIALGDAHMQKISDLHVEIERLKEQLAWEEKQGDLWEKMSSDQEAENERLRAELNQLRLNMAEYLVQYYQIDPVAVAEDCDERIDRTGALLGYVREAAIGGSQLGITPDECLELRDQPTVEVKATLVYAGEGQFSTPVEGDTPEMAELREENARLRSFASGHGMPSEADDWTEVAVLVHGLYDRIDRMHKALEILAEQGDYSVSDEDGGQPYVEYEGGADYPWDIAMRALEGVHEEDKRGDTGSPEV